MRRIEKREVWSAWVAFEEDPSRGKYRPVLVANAAWGDDKALAVPITSTPPRDEYDIEIFDWTDGPLDHLSTARVSKALPISYEDFRSPIGYVSKDDWENITGLLLDYLRFHPWG